MFVVSICSSCINFSRWLAPLVFHLYLYLLWRGSCLRVTLVSISISTSFIVLAYLTPSRYVHEFWLAQGLCLHIQFPKDMFISSIFFSSDLYGIYACIFNSWRICAQVLYSSLLNCMGSVLAIFNSRRICAQVVLVF